MDDLRATGGTQGDGNVGSGLYLGAALSGTHALGVTLTHGAFLNLAADNELGAVTLSGGPVVPNVPAGSNGSVSLNNDPNTQDPASLNATSGTA